MPLALKNIYIGFKIKALKKDYVKYISIKLCFQKEVLSFNYVLRIDLIIELLYYASSSGMGNSPFAYVTIDNREFISLL